jgi:ferrous iron transport protein A
MGADGLIPLGFMCPGDSGVLEDIRGLRHHGQGGPARTHAGPSKSYRRGHLFHADRGHRLEHRLNHMGLVRGERVKVLKNDAPGPLIVAVRGTRLCLGRGIASKVMIRPDQGDVCAAETPLQES